MKAGGYSSYASSYSASNAFNQPPAKFLRPIDVEILQELCRQRTLNHGVGGDYRLEGETGARLLSQILETGRCHWETLEGPLLKPGEPRARRHARWQTSVDGRQQPIFERDGMPVAVVALIPPHYIDRESGEIGPLETGFPGRLAAAFARAPLVKPSDVPKLIAALEKTLPDRALPTPAPLRKTRRKDVVPTPHLRLTTACLDYRRTRYWETPESDMAAVARLSFDYEGARIGAGDRKSDLTHVDGDQIVSIVRNRPAEKKCRARLEDLGFERIDALGLYEVTPDHQGDFIMIGPDPEEEPIDPERALLGFSHRHLPALRAEGWIVEIDEDYPIHIAEAGDDWFADVQERSGIDWFRVELGILIDGKRVSVLPLLLDFLESMRFGAGIGDLDELTAGEVTFVPLEDGRFAPLDSERLRPLLAALFELFEMGMITDEGELRLNPMQAADLAELAAATVAIDLRWLGGERLLELGARLRSVQSIRPVPLPEGFKGELRLYQKEGLSWLQFLREVELGGILADDMGLGKTVQTLAHILVEKRSGRATRPSLVIAPTSLMANWRLEAKRFAPDLKVLTLHGSRAQAVVRENRRSRPGADHLRPPPPRQGDPSRPGLSSRDPGRGAGHQEPEGGDHAASCTG